jgi:menaquinol-cytochrome c reductase iron-sulfur subunit
MPESPAAGEPVSRRRFLGRLSLALGAGAAALVGVPVIGFLVSPLLRQPPQAWRPVGAVANFAVGATVRVTFLDASPLPWAGVAARTAAWLRREAPDQFVAFAVNCTHLGCPVRWLGDADLFMCPCHGGVYDKRGDVAAGPPPRPLFRYPVRVQHGIVEVLATSLPIP